MPVVRVALHLPGITSGLVAIDFLVDTGSTDTYLHPQDAKIRLGIAPARLATPQSWPNHRSTTGIGGTVTCYVAPAVYVFRHDDGCTRRITHEIHIAPPAVTNATLPSLLGMDILSQFRVTMDYVGNRLVLE